MAVARSSRATSWSTSTSLFSKNSTMRVELATGGHVAELRHRVVGSGGGLVAPFCVHVCPSVVDRCSVASTVELARPSANLVNSVDPARSSATERTTAPSGPSVMV